MRSVQAIRVGGRRQAALATKRAAHFSTQSSPSGSSGNGSGSGGFRFAEMIALAGGIGAAGVAISQGFVPHEWVIRHLSEPVLMPLVRLFDPETAHVIAVKSASLGLIPRVRVLCIIGRVFACCMGLHVEVYYLLTPSINQCTCVGPRNGLRSAQGEGVRSGVPEPAGHGCWL